MIKLIKELFLILTSVQRKNLLKLQILIILMTFTEILGVASIAPFMAVVASPDLIESNISIKFAYELTHAQNSVDFMIYMGVGVLLALSASALVSVVTTWRLSLFASRIGAEIGESLYQYYLNETWLFHASGSSARLTKHIANETWRLTNGVLIPVMNLYARFIMAVVLSLAIFLINPILAVIGGSFFVVAYLLIYKTVRYRLMNNGIEISKASEERFKLMNEGFGGIKDVILLGRRKAFQNRFAETSTVLAESQGQNTALAQMPRYLMELVAFGTLIALVLYLLVSLDGDLTQVLPLLSVYALAGYKLLPAFQQIYSSVATIKGDISAFEMIRNDLEKARTVTSSLNEDESRRVTRGYLYPKSEIVIDTISFTYPDKSIPVLNQLSITIKANSVVGIVGASGSGKSTLIDVLLGLIESQEGSVKIDGIEITDYNRRAWQNSIGFVPQSIFLSDGTIAENVAFGIAKHEIDILKVNKALGLAHLDELVQGLEYGIQTKVGERGVQLSGGQRQRIGIARALYHDAEVLIFDEATSALDGITEKMIMEAIHEFSGQKTIIMIAHRLQTVKRCDQIFFLDSGELVDKGTYEELIENNEKFRFLAAHA